MTKRECAIVMAYTNIVMLSGDDLKYFEDYVEEKLGFPIFFTREYPKYVDAIKEAATEDFLKLCDNAVDSVVEVPKEIREWHDKCKKRSAKNDSTESSWKEPDGGFKSIEDRERFYM